MIVGNPGIGTVAINFRLGSDIGDISMVVYNEVVQASEEMTAEKEHQELR
jgi:hypothetical protein